MAYEYNKLKGKIVEMFKTQSKFAEAMNWSERTLSLKMSGKRPWKQTDISRAVELLHINIVDIPDYFFVEKVQNIEHSDMREF